LNHAATNSFWNFCFSLDNLSSTKNPYIYFESDTAPFEKKTETSQSISILNNKRPNIVLIITESFTSKVMEYFGEHKDITPYTDSLITHGILFKNFYANGDRTDKGLVSVLSGYPTQPTDAVIKYPQKTQHLPQLATELKKYAYYTRFYYGGDANFASMYSYLNQGNYNDIIDIQSFSSNERNSKWGFHDHVLLNKMSQDMDTFPQPFFTVCLTLSNHEPYDTPVEYGSNEGKTDEEKFLNTCKYTDWAIGNFIQSAKDKDWYKNTLFIIVADHGHSLPGNDDWSSLRKFRIPLIFYGDVLSVQDSVIETIAMQTDIASTLLHQLGISSVGFNFSENILSPSHPSVAFYTFNNGFGYVCKDGHIIFDQTSGKPIESEGNNKQKIDSLGKSYMQKSYSHFLGLQFGL
jgi:phosphoglycerol transferase MdoB-like AlkP superfamily enzyme